MRYLLKPHHQMTERKLYQGITDCLWKTYRREGVTGLYKGYFVSAAGVVPYFAITLAAYDEMKVGLLLEEERMPRVGISNISSTSQGMRVHSSSDFSAFASLL